VPSRRGPEANGLVDVIRAPACRTVFGMGGSHRTARRVSSVESVTFPATVFEQVNPVMGDRARDWAVAALGDISGHAGWDLYAGIGETRPDAGWRGARASRAWRGTCRAVRLRRVAHWRRRRVLGACRAGGGGDRHGSVPPTS
jgi:hypothetical protein